MTGRRRRRRRVALAFGALGCAAALAVAGCSTRRDTVDPVVLRRLLVDEGTRLNQLQTVGTHNSYHLEAPAAEETLRHQADPGDEATLEYGHPPLTDQFSQERIRQIELDVHLDDRGGLFAHPFLRKALNEGDLPYEAEMLQPGIKVLHVHDVDYLSNCPTFVDCLRTLSAWSKANPSHAPIMVLVELVDTPITTLPASVQVQEEPWTVTTITELDRDIRANLRPDQLITPDDLRGKYPSVEAAALAGNWPTLGSSRGKFLFTMDNRGSYRSAYLQAHPDAKGAVIFPNGDPPGPGVPPEPWRAFVEMNDPTGPNALVIADLVQKGYVVRTRADADTAEARSGSVTTRDAAFASGAQWVSTDYPVPGLSARFGTSYVASLPSGTTVRCNPINGSLWCRGHDAALDDLRVLPPMPLPTGTTTYQSPPTSHPPTGAD